MKISLPYLDQVRALRIKITDPTTSRPEDSAAYGGGGFIADLFSKIIASLLAAYHKEHNPDDSHARIHCDLISERDRTTPMGEWIDATIADAASFTASGAMTWTVDIADQANRYTLIGTTMILNVRLESTSVGGVVSNALQMRIPGGFKAKKPCSTTCLVYDNTAATAVLGQARALIGNNYIEFFRFDGLNYTASANNTSIVAQIAIEVQ